MNEIECILFILEKFCKISSLHVSSVRFVLVLVVVEKTTSLSSDLKTVPAAFTSCTGLGVTEWNDDVTSIKLNLQSWLLSTVTLLTTTSDRDTKYHQVKVAEICRTF